jgi:hypothetical protein
MQIEYSVNCSEKVNGLVSKCPLKENSAKLLLTENNQTSSLWILAIDYNKYILTYQCSKRDDKGITIIKGELQLNFFLAINNCNRDHNHIPDYYKIYSRKDSISESVLQNLKTILNSLSDDIIMSPISHSNENKS